MACEIFELGIQNPYPWDGIQNLRNWKPVESNRILGIRNLSIRIWYLELRILNTESWNLKSKYLLDLHVALIKASLKTFIVDSLFLAPNRWPSSKWALNYLKNWAGLTKDSGKSWHFYNFSYYLEPGSCSSLYVFWLHVVIGYGFVCSSISFSLDHDKTDRHFF